MKKDVLTVIAFMCIATGYIEAQTNKIAKFNSTQMPTGLTQSSIFDNGSVGINTTAPSRKFQVHSNVSMEQVYISSSSPSIFLGDNAVIGSASNVGTFAMATATDRFATGVVAGDVVLSSKFGKTHFVSGASYNKNGFIRMTLDASGRVGIGTSAPSSTLHLIGMANDGTNAALKIESGSNALIMDGSTLDANTELFINSRSGKNISLCKFSGNVGIGVSNSNARLEIAGYPNGITDAPTLKLSSNGGFDLMSFDGKRIETSGTMYINNTSKNNLVIGGKVGIDVDNPTSSLQISGIENDGTNATLRIQSSSSETMLLDGNEIDANGPLYINKNSKSNIALCPTGGTVGIGASNPTSTLQINGIGNDGTNGTLKLITDDQVMILDGNEIDAATQLHINRNSKKDVTLCEQGGNVGIGVTSPQNKLDVKGTIKAEEVIVSTSWSDFVFEKDYQLKTLAEVEKFINSYKHLPEIPDAKEVEKNGIAVGQIQSKLLMKIEELTLYIIEQNKEILEQTKRIESLEAN